MIPHTHTIGTMTTISIQTSETFITTTTTMTTMMTITMTITTTTKQQSTPYCNHYGSPGAVMFRGFFVGFCPSRSNDQLFPIR